MENLIAGLDGEEIRSNDESGGTSEKAPAGSTNDGGPSEKAPQTGCCNDLDPKMPPDDGHGAVLAVGGLGLVSPFQAALVSRQQIV
jgi:hypothetical protein